MKSREMMDEKGERAAVRSADEHNAGAVRAAVDALNRAIEDAAAEGLAVEIDVTRFEMIGRHKHPVLSASIARTI
jgi:hypothetical protein